MSYWSSAYKRQKEKGNNNIETVITSKGSLRSKQIKKAGFTLAEVLITLGIIGVVAAITLPMVVSEYKKSVTVAQLKKSYSTLSNALKAAEAQEGVPVTQLSDVTYRAGNRIFLDPNILVNKYIKPQLRIAKSYSQVDELSAMTRNCIAPSEDLSSILGSGRNYYVTLHGWDLKTYYIWRKYYSFLLQDGSCITIGEKDGGAWSDNDKEYVPVSIDVNGSHNGPNISGIDLFSFAINKQSQLIPLCNDWTDRQIKENASGCNLSYKGWAGQCCAAKIMRDGWKIKKDYPWSLSPQKAR